jgi:hypothetical protein
MSCIDPHLDSGSELTEADVVAAVQAVLLQAESQEAAKKEKQQAEKEKQRQLEIEMEMEMEMHTHDPRSSHDERDDGDSITANGELGMDNAMSRLHSYGSSLGRPEPMEHILTEDGEPMLNPGLFVFALILTLLWVPDVETMQRNF